MKSEPQRLTLGLEIELQAYVQHLQVLCDLGTSPAVFVVTINMYFQPTRDVFPSLTKWFFCALT